METKNGKTDIAELIAEVTMLLEEVITETIPDDVAQSLLDRVHRALEHQKQFAESQ